MQLWENGPKWAVFNVGVTDGKAESYGNFYTYGAAGDLWGSYWRLPTKQDFDNLLSVCDKVSETINGVKGMLVSGRGAYSSNKVFFPAGGYNDPYSTPTSQRVGEFGRYWSSTYGSQTSCGYCMGFNDDPSVPFVSNGGDYFGHSVRAVLAE